MHVPDGFLSASVAGATWVVAVTGVGAALRTERRDPHPMPAGVLGAAAAFVFAAQMINVPVAPATSGHLVGAALATALLGPWRAIVAMSVVLAIQALLFQDGGIAALGANIVDMGLGGVCAAYAVMTITGRSWRGPRGHVTGAALGAFFATLVSATLTAVWLGLSGLYPLRGILPVMLVTHVFIGVLESALTAAILVTVVRWRPDLVRGLSSSTHVAHPAAAAWGMLGVAIAVAAFLSPWASALPDGLDHAAETLGFANRAATGWQAPFPDYVLPFAQSAGAATAAAGVVGTLAAAAIGWFISHSVRGSGAGTHA